MHQEPLQTPLGVGEDRLVTCHVRAHARDGAVAPRFPPRSATHVSVVTSARETGHTCAITRRRSATVVAMIGHD